MEVRKIRDQFLSRGFILGTFFNGMLNFHNLFSALFDQTSSFPLRPLVQCRVDNMITRVVYSEQNRAGHQKNVI